MHRIAEMRCWFLHQNPHRFWCTIYHSPPGMAVHKPFHFSFGESLHSSHHNSHIPIIAAVFFFWGRSNAAHRISLKPPLICKAMVYFTLAVWVIIAMPVFRAVIVIPFLNSLLGTAVVLWTAINSKAAVIIFFRHVFVLAKVVMTVMTLPVMMIP